MHSMRRFPYNHPIRDSHKPSARATGQTPPGPGSSLPLSVHNPRCPPQHLLGQIATCGEHTQQQQNGVSVTLPHSPALCSWPSGCPCQPRGTPELGPGGAGWCCTTRGGSQKHCWRCTPAHQPADGGTQALSTAATCPCEARVTQHSEPCSELQAPLPLHDSDGHQDKPTHSSN